MRRDLIVLRLAPGLAPNSEHAVAQVAQAIDDTDGRLLVRGDGLVLANNDRELVASPIAPIDVACVPVQLFFGPAGQDALRGNDAGQHTRREGSAAEAVNVDTISLLVVAAQEQVHFDDVALQPNAEYAAEDRERFEGGGADAVVVIRDLTLLPVARRVAQVERLVEPPYI